MPRYKLLVEYDGGPWHGWQTQPNVPTIQDALESALHTILNQTVGVVGSGRTDAGVHARGQVAHVDVPSDAPTPFRLIASLNGLTPPSIAVRDVSNVDSSFHARYDARGRRYHYYMGTQPFALERDQRYYCYPPPDVDAMNEAAKELLGPHDFSSFCLTRSETENRNCEVRTAEWLPCDKPGAWQFVICADRFLHGMVRAIVGTLIEIGQGKRERGLREIIRAVDRRAAGFAAPAVGLILEEVVY